MKLRRLIAAIIDFVIIGYIILIPLWVIDQFINGIFIDIFIGITGLVAFFNMYIRKDCLIGNNSIGKKIVKLKICQNEKELKDQKALIKRNYITFWTIPYYPFMVLYNNKSEGDIKCNTEVKSFRKK